MVRVLVVVVVVDLGVDIVAIVEADLDRAVAVDGMKVAFAVRSAAGLGVDLGEMYVVAADMVDCIGAGIFCMDLRVVLWD